MKVIWINILDLEYTKLKQFISWLANVKSNITRYIVINDHAKLRAC